MPQGKRLTALATALLLMAAAAAIRLAAGGALAEFRRPPGSAPESGARAFGEQLAAARTAEESGDIAAALAHYRAAASLDPLCVDRRSATFLGPRFEENLRRWSADLRGGRMKADPQAVRDASYLFRRMYGGCG